MDEKLRLYVEREQNERLSIDDNDILKAGKQKLNDVLIQYENICGFKKCEELTRDIEAFIGEREINEDFLFRFCYQTRDLLGFDSLINTQLSFQCRGVEYQNLKYNEESNELSELEKFIRKNMKKPTFADTVIEIMRNHNMTDPDVYKNAHLHRQVYFQALQSGRPKKNTVWNIIVGLNCNLDEADILLNSAGFIRTNSILDLVLTYFITHKSSKKILNITSINICLDEFGETHLLSDLPTYISK